MCWRPAATSGVIGLPMRDFPVFMRLAFFRRPVARVVAISGAYATTVLIWGGLGVYGLHALVGQIAAELSLIEEAEPIDRLEFPAAAELLHLNDMLVTRLTFPAAPALVPYFPRPAPGAETPSGPVDLAASNPGENESAAPWSSGEARTYRTMCVRLCDGHFFPISFATSREFFANDEAVCRKSCATPARLYVFKNPGETPAAMENLNGQRYTKLDTAYLFRAKYNPSCTCHGQPSSQEARDRHRLYALRAAKASGKAGAAGKEELAGLESAFEARRNQSEAAYREASLEVPARGRGQVDDWRVKSRTRSADLAPSRRSTGFPGVMRVGRFERREPAPSKPESAPQRHGTSIGDMIRQSLGGF